MGKPRRELLTETAKLQELLNMPKIIYDHIELAAPIAGQNRQETTIQMIYNESGETITGLSAQLVSIRSVGFKYHSFSLRYQPKLRHFDVFAQLEIEPADKKAHTEAGGIQIFGAHFVQLNHATKVPDQPTWTWYDWLREFKQRVHLQTYGTLIAPFTGELDL